jgi:O-antigen ligase
MTTRPWDSDDLCDLRELRLRALWSAFRREGLAFWLLCVYLMFEYVRPQSIFPALALFPWATTTMMATAVAWLAGRPTARVSTPANWFLLLYSVLLLLSSIGAYRPRESFSQFDGYFLWVVAYGLIILIVTTERRMLLMLLAFVLFNVKMTQFAFRNWMAIAFHFRASGTGGAPGWFANSGEFGIEMCMFLPIILYLTMGLRPHLSRWKFFALLGIAGTAIVGIVASSSRGALVGGAAVMLFMLARSKRKARALASVIVIGTLIFVAIPPESKLRMSNSGADLTSQLRLTYWTRGIEITNDHPLLGIGYGNWAAYYGDHYDGPVQQAHNSVLQAASELGYPGLLSLLLLVGCSFALNARSRALAIRAGPDGRLTYNLAIGLDGALIGFLVSGFFISALYYPFFWINLAMTVALATVAKRLPVTSPARLSTRVGDQLRFGAARGIAEENPESSQLFPVRQRRART